MSVLIFGMIFVLIKVSFNNFFYRLQEYNVNQRGRERESVFNRVDQDRDIKFIEQ